MYILHGDTCIILTRALNKPGEMMFTGTQIKIHAG
jgi:hypothetical protein